MCVSNEIRDQNLKKIAKNYFGNRYLYNELAEGNALQGKSGQKWNFDGVVEAQNCKFGVFIKDWNRSIGVHQVRLLEKACLDMGFDGGLLVGNYFSSHVKTYGQNKGVHIVSKSEILTLYILRDIPTMTSRIPPTAAGG